MNDTKVLAVEVGDAGPTEPSLEPSFLLQYSYGSVEVF